MPATHRGAPLAIDLCCGLGGWTEGLQAEGYHARGYDIEAHEYDGERYPGELVVQSILTLDGADCADADLIVASPPCTEYSYMAMPWSRAKQIAAALRGETEFPEGYRGSRTVADLNALFDACFRIQREASEAAGRLIPMVVENVKGAQPWVGRARWSYGSFFLWGDVPALMPLQKYHSRQKVKAGEQWNINRPNFTGTRGWDDEGLKAPGGLHIRDGAKSTFRLTNPAEGRKVAGDWFGSYADMKASGTISPGRLHGKGSVQRKAASARIAKIPQPLSRHIARTYLPMREAAA